MEVMSPATWTRDTQMPEPDIQMEVESEAATREEEQAAVPAKAI